jgi:ubiquinone biosynthesis protein COQ9
VRVENANEASAVGTRLPLTRVKVRRLVDGSTAVATRNTGHLHDLIVAVEFSVALLVAVVPATASTDAMPYVWKNCM